MRGRPIHYSAEELEWIEWRRAMSRRALHAAFVERFGREDVSLVNLIALCKRKGWTTGRTGRFEKGQAPLNKGRKCPPGKGGRHPNAQATQFRAGDRPHTYRGPGHESVRSDGYVWLIVAERNPHTGAATRPVMKHRWLWEQANGPVPADHVLKSLDGDRTNTDPDNWIAVPRSLLPRLAGRWRQHYDSAPAELKPTLLAIAKLEDAARARRRRPEEGRA